MSISDELHANILRYYHVEKWRVGTISFQLGVHHSTIKRVLSETGIPKKKILVQASMIDPYLSFVLETLQRYPSLRASRLYAMVKERGYPGGVDHFRHLISALITGMGQKNKGTPKRKGVLSGVFCLCDWLGSHVYGICGARGA